MPCESWFSKAFDKVDRDYIFPLLDKIGVNQYTKSAIRTVYNVTKAIIEINGYLSKTIVLQRKLGKNVRFQLYFSYLLLKRCSAV